MTETSPPDTRLSPMEYAALAIVGVLLVGGVTVAILLGSDAISASPAHTTLRVALPSFGTETLDPSLDAQAGLQYHGHLYDFLVGIQPGGLSAESGLLEKWELGADSSEYRLTLKDGLLWQDGSPVTAEDIAFSLSHYTREKAVCTVCPELKKWLAGVEVSDARTAVLRLNDPDVSFLGRLGPIEGDAPLLSSRHWARLGDQGLAEAPLGTGPWRFSRRTVRESIEFEANPEYWDVARRPVFQRLHIAQVPEPEVRLALLRTEQVDIAPVGVADIGPLKLEGFEVMGPRYVVSTQFRFLMSYDQAHLTSRLEFRNALTLALDMPFIVGSIYPLEAATLSSGSALFTPLTPGFDPALSFHAYDALGANQLLESSGYAGEEVALFSITAYGLTQMPRMNELVAEYWRRIGLNVTIMQTEWPLLQSRLDARPQQLDDAGVAPMFQGAAPSGRPGGVVAEIRRYLVGERGSLLTYFNPEAGSRLFAELGSVLDEEERTRRLVELNRQMFDEYWSIPVAWHHDTYAVSADLTGWTPTDGTSSDLHFETVRLKR